MTVRYSLGGDPSDRGEVGFCFILRWLIDERELHQMLKFDYGLEDLKHALEGLDEDSWFWQRGVENYAQRVRTAGITHPIGVQAHLKLIATLVAQLEHLLREGVLDELPRPGSTSGEILPWGRIEVALKECRGCTEDERGQPRIDASCPRHGIYS
jgi:hypothetical protein